MFINPDEIAVTLVPTLGSPKKVYHPRFTYPKCLIEESKSSMKITTFCSLRSTIGLPVYQKVIEIIHKNQSSKDDDEMKRRSLMRFQEYISNLFLLSKPWDEYQIKTLKDMHGVLLFETTLRVRELQEEYDEKFKSNK